MSGYVLTTVQHCVTLSYKATDIDRANDLEVALSNGSSGWIW